jgi:uncharacterized protein YkwD
MLLLAMMLITGALLGSLARVTTAGDLESATSAAMVSQPDPDSPERRMYGAVNAQRVAQGVTPLAWSEELGTAAALHSADMAANGFLDHYGSDGADQQQRAARAGYIVPRGSGWMVIEAISARPSVEAALGWLMSDGVHRRVLLRSIWREVGIGYSAGGRYGGYWTLDFACRPNVLPVFAEPSDDGQSLSLTFTNENCAASGGGPEQMGRAAELMLSAYADFRDGVWEPFVGGRQVARPTRSELNVRLRDGNGRLSEPVRLRLEAESPSGLLPQDGS